MWPTENYYRHTLPGTQHCGLRQLPSSLNIRCVFFAHQIFKGCGRTYVLYASTIWFAVLGGHPRTPKSNTSAFNLSILWCQEIVVCILIHEEQLCFMKRFVVWRLWRPTHSADEKFMIEKNGCGNERRSRHLVIEHIQIVFIPWHRMFDVGGSLPPTCLAPTSDNSWH